VRWWVSVAILSACHAPAAPAAAPSVDPALTCKVSDPVCDATMSDDAALAMVQRRCAGCHDEGGAAAHPFLQAPALLRERANVALRLAGCEMPPDATPLPSDERARLIGWGACAPAEIAPAPREIAPPKEPQAAPVRLPP
jgi:hypothetical protein